MTIFGGAPAPATFKRLKLFRVPLAFEPLHLSGLVLLDLSQVNTISTPELLEILRRSPWLETLILKDNRNLLAIGSQASNIQPTELPKLVSLTLSHMDDGGTNSILSNIRVPNPRRCVLVKGNVRRDSARSILLTPDIAHLLHAPMPTTDPPVSIINVHIGVDSERTWCSIQFRGVSISVVADGKLKDHIQEMFRWLADGLGSEAVECPVHMELGCANLDPMRLTALPPPFIVKHLSISGYTSERLQKNFYLAMARPQDLTPSGWLLPQIESLGVRVEDEDSAKLLISMLRRRYEGVTLEGETGSRCPTQLRSVELRARNRIDGLVEEIKEILGEVNVFWI